MDDNYEADRLQIYAQPIDFANFFSLFYRVTTAHAKPILRKKIIAHIVRKIGFRLSFHKIAYETDFTGHCIL